MDVLDHPGIQPGIQPPEQPEIETTKELPDSPEKQQADKIYAVLTRNEIRREYPPAQAEIKKSLLECLEKKEPVELVIVWGGFKNTEKGRADQADELTLDSAKKTVDALEQLGVKVEPFIYFSNLHAISPYFGRDISFVKKSENYAQDMKEMAEQRDFQFISLSSAIYGISQYELEKSLKGEPGYKSFYIHDPKIKERFMFKGRSFWDKASEQTKQEIMQAASKYCSEEAIQKEGLENLAILYAGSRLHEKEWLEEIHRNGVFMSYGRPNYEIQPENTIACHSVKRGISKQPWLIDAEKELKKPE